jgi:putative spermidine/putrescine transport system permease protein
MVENSASGTSSLRTKQPLKRLLGRERLVLLSFLGPGLIVLTLVFFLPLANFLVQGFLSPEPGVQNFISALGDPVYRRILVDTLEVSLITAAACAVLGYPVAYALSTGSPRTRLIIFALVLIPFWTNILVRMFAWIAVLGSHGIVNTTLIALGLIEVPIKILYTRFAVVLGMTQFLLPYMILACYAVMANIPSSLLDAAANLGARPRSVFVRVYFPLSAPGLVAGFLLVFIISLGFFVTPALLGPQDQKLLAQVIENQVNDTLNWGFAAALSIILVVVTTMLYAVYDQLLTTAGDKR